MSCTGPESAEAGGTCQKAVGALNPGRARYRSFWVYRWGLHSLASQPFSPATDDRRQPRLIGWHDDLGHGRSRPRGAAFRHREESRCPRREPPSLSLPIGLAAHLAGSLIWGRIGVEKFAIRILIDVMGVVVLASARYSR